MPRENVHQFIIEKIQQLQSALFFPETSDRIIPVCVLQQIQADEQEQIWFAVPSPAYAIDTNQPSFPCRIDFFKKGAAFHVKITGLATIMEEGAVPGSALQLAAAGNDNGNQKRLIIKVEIAHADYFELPSMQPDRNNGTMMDFISGAYNKISGQLFGKGLSQETPAYN